MTTVSRAAADCRTSNASWRKLPPAALTALTLILATAATITFPFAVLRPFCSFEQSFGDDLADAFYEQLNPGFLDPKTNSVLSGIAQLFTDAKRSSKIVAVVLLLFSVLFPAIKLTLLWGILVWPGSRRNKRRLVRLLELLGPWSMADVFVVSIVLATLILSHIGTFSILDGYYYYLFSVVSALIATLLTDIRLSRVAQNQSFTCPHCAHKFNVDQHRSVSPVGNPSPPVIGAVAEAQGIITSEAST